MAKGDAAVRIMPPLAAVDRCRLCRARLAPEDPRDGIHDHVCAECRKHPAAARLGATMNAGAAPRAFTPADKSMIAKVHGYMPAQQLLELLNERLAADLGPDAASYTMEQLHAELRVAAVPADAGDWAGLRKLLANARRDGVLEHITGQVIDDFAVVYSLTPAQVLRVKDVMLTARGDRK